MSEYSISVIIPVYNAAETLPMCIESLAYLDRDDVEVIFIDDGSTDRSREIVAESPFQVILGDHAGPSAARNRGIEAAQAELVAFTDSDCIVPSNWLSELESALVSADAVGVGGGQCSPDDESPMGRKCQNLLEQLGFAGDYIHGSSEPTEVRHNASCNVLYRKQALKDVGGFKDNFYPGEDVDLDHRLGKQGHSFVFTPKATVAHYRPSTLSGCLRMMRRYGWAQTVLMRLHGPFRLLHFLPFVLVTLVVLLVAATVVNPLVGASAAAVSALFAYIAICFKAQAVVRPLFSSLMVAHWHLGFYSGLFCRLPGRLPARRHVRHNVAPGGISPRSQPEVWATGDQRVEVVAHRTSANRQRLRTHKA